MSWIGINKLAGGTCGSPGTSFGRKVICADTEDILFNFQQFRWFFFKFQSHDIPFLMRISVFLHQRTANMKALFLDSIMAIQDHFAAKATRICLLMSIDTIHLEQEYFTIRFIADFEFLSSSLKTVMWSSIGHWDLLPYSSVTVNYQDFAGTNADSTFRVYFACREKRSTGCKIELFPFDFEIFFQVVPTFNLATTSGSITTTAAPLTTALPLTTAPQCNTLRLTSSQHAPCNQDWSGDELIVKVNGKESSCSDKSIRVNSFFYLNYWIKIFLMMRYDFTIRQWSSTNRKWFHRRRNLHSKLWFK